MYFLGKKRSRKVTTFFYLITQLSSTADNDNIAYVIKGRVVYDEDGNIDYDKSDDTIYYKVYDKDGNEVDGGTPKPIYLKTRRTEFGKVLSDVPIEGYVNNELYPQEQNNIQQAINNGPTNIEQSTPEESVSTDERQGVTSSQNTILSDKEADLLMSAMEQNAEAMPAIELTPDNWVAEFGQNGTVSTPIGDVKMGDNQLAKLFLKKRTREFGMIKPTLVNPDVIIEKTSVADNAERNTKLLFVKTFKDESGQKHVHFENVTVQKGGLEVSISSHIVDKSAIRKELANGIVIYNKPELTSIGSDVYLTETHEGQSDLVPTQEANSDSQDKGTTNNLNEQEEFYNSLPRNKRGEVDESQMSAEQKIGYAQAEFGQRADLVRDYVAEQSKALSEKIAKLTNKTGKSVAEYKELAAMQEDKNVFVEYLNEQRQQQEQAMPRRTVEEAAAEREERRAAEKEQREQAIREKEERDGVPDFMQDTPEDARLRGFRLRTGERIDRQEPIETGKYNTARRKFTNDTGAVEGGRPTVKRTIIDNAQTKLQPSHRGGRANIYHFITEAQPKERTDKASRVSAAQIAANINPEEITGGITAYNGSPIANNRLEVIQGNNRAEALRLMYEEYPKSAEAYKQYLIDNAENYGMSADEVRTMKEPIAVDIYEGTDGNAILLGQYTQQDVESGGVHRINPSGVIKHLKSHNMLDRFITGLLKGVDEENTVSDVIAANLRDVLPILDKTGAISMTQRQGFFDERGDVTSGAIDDFKGILTSLITEGGYANINSDFMNLPDSAKTALYLQTYRAVLNKQDGPTISNDIQNSILLYTLVFGKNNKGKVGADEARREVTSWLMTAQPDFNAMNEDGTYPLVDMREKFSNFAAELAILYKSTNLRSSKDKGRGLYTIWDDFYNLLEGKGDLFTTGEKKSLRDSINENFNIDYVPIRQNEHNTLGSRGEARRAGRRGSDSKLGVGEQSEARTETADGRGRAEADIAEAVKDIDVEPTEAQKKAGNYKKGHVKIQGFDITIENPKGAIRRGVDDNGKAWSTEMKNHYGYFKNTEGKDGDHIDVFIGDNPNSKKIFVVDQVNPKTGEFDESKVMLGFDTEDEAKKAYLSNYSKDWKGFKDITYVDIDTFRDWLYDGAKQRKPFGEYSNVRFRSIKDVNDRFNEELQQQIDGTLPKGHVYSLGMPNDILRSAGLPNLPIEMSAEMLKNKSSAKYRQHHPFDISSIKDLPRAIQNPIAVFNNPNNDGKVLLTELQYNGVNHIVAIKVRSERKSNNIEIDVNSVSTIFPKDRIEKIVEWLLDKENQGRKAYLNKEKVLTWLSDNETITRSKGYNTKDIAKVIKDFDNPTISGEKNEETRLKASKRKARGATTEKLEELVTLLKKTGFADVKTGEDFYKALAEIKEGKDIEYMRPKGTVLGFVKGNTIYLNPDEVSLNTPIHEFGHLWVSQVKEHFPDLWAKGKELFLESDYLRKVQADENYRHLDLDGQIDEAMARAIGDRGEQELDKTLLEKILDWIAEVWEKIGGVFGIDNLTSEQISNLTLQDFTDMATSELLSGQNLTERVNGNRGGATRYNTADETADIKARAIADGTFMKAPNGKDTNLTERQWLQVRTKAFKKWFGDWEKTARIEKLKKTKPIEITGEEYKGKYELNVKSGHKWILDNLRGTYTVKDTGEKVNLSRVSANEITSHGEREDIHLKSFAVIPQMIENAIFIDETDNYKGNNKYDKYKYYVVGLNVDGVPYTARIVVGEKNGKTYYDHELTQIEKGTIIDSLNGTTTSVAKNANALSEYKDSKLISLLQENSSKVVDENGEPLVVYHGTNNEFYTFEEREGYNSELLGGERKVKRAGFFFSPDKNFANNYGRHNLPVFLNIKNLFNFKEHYYYTNSINETLSELFDEFVEYADEQGINLYNDYPMGYDYYIISPDDIWRFFDDELGSVFKRFVQSKGFDSVWFPEWNSDVLVNNFMLFSPTQIKSATDNIGTFNGEDEDIRYMLVDVQDEKAIDEERRRPKFEIKGDDVYTTMYTARADTETEIDVLYNGNDFEKALSKAEGYNEDSDREDLTVGVEAVRLKIPIAAIKEEYDYDDEEYDGYVAPFVEDNIDDFVENTDYDRYETGRDMFDVYKSKENNANTDEIISDVQNELSLRSGIKIGKYSDFYIDRYGKMTSDATDEYGNSNIGVSMRIADHTHNPRNGKSSLNVVIADDNKTKSRFIGAKEDLLFDSSNSVEYIVDEIEDFWRDYAEAHFGDVMEEGSDFVNERFNEQLEHLTEANADSTIMSCGLPSAPLLSVGIPDKDMRLYGNKLLKKSKLHGYKISDVKDLPDALQEPIAIFEGSHVGSFAVLTELEINGKKSLVSVDINKGELQDLNIITSVFGKGEKGVIHWINNGKMLFVDKEKALAWQATLAPIASATLKQELITATKVIENFENPPINEKKVIDDTTNDMVRYSIKASEQLDKEDEVMGETKSPQTKGFWFCDPEGIRTPDPQLRRLLLYPAELPDLYTILS